MAKPRRNPRLSASTAISRPIPENELFNCDLVTQDVARRQFIERVLSLLSGEHAQDIIDATTWDELAMLVVQHWAQFDERQSPLSTLTMLGYCAQMKLRIKLAEIKTPQDDANNAALDAMMQDIFQLQPTTQESAEA